jgi:hypothetical protein
MKRAMCGSNRPDPAAAMALATRDLATMSQSPSGA